MGLCAGNIVDNTGMFWLLSCTKSMSYTTTELYKARTFYFLSLTTPVRLGVHKQLGGDTGGTADPN